MRQLKITKSITNRENASLDKYLKEIGKEDLITAEEEVELGRRIKAGDKRALDKLCTSNLRFVVSVAKQYQNQGLSLPDLINEGNLGLIKAAERFDETRGFKFISYAVWWIRQSILQALGDQSRIVRLSSNKIGAISKIKKESARLEQKLERMPSIEELSEAMEIPVGKIEDDMIYYKKGHLSLDEPTADGEATTLVDNFEDQDYKTDKGLIYESLVKEVNRSLSTLSEKEREVVSLYFGIGIPHQMTLEEIAKKFDLTRERVRQIKEKAIRRLKQTARSKILKTYLGQ